MQLADLVSVHDTAKWPVHWIYDIMGHMPPFSHSEGLFKNYYIIQNKDFIPSNSFIIL